MGCGCGGSIPTPTSPAPTATEYTVARGPHWVVTYPNSEEMAYWNEWAASQAQALSGGTIRRIDPEEAGHPTG